MKMHMALTPKLKWYIVQTALLWILVAIIVLDGLGASVFWLAHRHLAFSQIANGARTFRYISQAFSFTHHLVIITWLCLLALLFLAYLPILRRLVGERKQYEQRDDYASHGTARFMTKGEVRKYFYRTQQGILVGSYDAQEYWPVTLDKNAPEPSWRPKQAASAYAVHPFDDVLNNQYLIIGPPGSNKTTGFVLPNVYHQLQLGSTIVVTDPKGEVYKLTANYAKQHGYAVIVLDYIYFSYGHQFNNLQYIRSEKDIKTVANVFMGATKGKDEKDDFWSQKAQSLLTALIGYVLCEKGRKGTWGDVYDCLVDQDLLDPTRGPFIIQQAGLTGLSLTEYKAFIRATDEVREGVIATLASRMQTFAIDDVRKQSADTDFDLYQIGYEKTIIYVWISDSDTAFRAQSALFWNTFFNAQYEAARRTDDRLALAVVPILEEMANIGRIDDYMTKLTTMRGRGLKPLHIWHSIPQLQAVYGKEEAAAFMGACDTTIVLGNNDLETAKVLSELVGDTTIRVANQGERAAATLNAQTEQQTYQGRRLMQASELRAMENQFTLVLQRGRSPVLLKKAQYRYWETMGTKRQLCEAAHLKDLPRYGQGARVDDLTDYTFLRSLQPHQNPPLEPVSATTADFLGAVMDDTEEVMP